MNTILLCKNCEHVIKSWGEMAYTLATAVMKEYAAGGECRIHLDGSSDSKRTLQVALFLERKGIFITTENGHNEIKMKPLGLNFTTGNSCFFCFGFEPKKVD